MRYFPLRILRIEKQQASFVFPFQSLLAAHKVKCQPPESWITKRAAHVGIDVQAGGGGQRCHGMPAGLTFSGMPWERQQSSWFTQSKGKRQWWMGEGLQGREGTRVMHLHAGLLSFPVTHPPAPCFCCCCCCSHCSHPRQWHHHHQQGLHDHGQWLPVSCKGKRKSLSRVRLCHPRDYAVHGILQARILETVAYPFSRESSWPRNLTGDSCIADRFFTNWAVREAMCIYILSILTPVQFSLHPFYTKEFMHI